MTAMPRLRYERAEHGVRRLSLARHIAVEMVRAGAVLALVFLSFVPMPSGVSSPHGGDLLSASVDLSWCGDGHPADDNSHAPCHACRVLGAALPPAEGGLVDRPLLPCADVARVDVLVFVGLPADIPAARGPPRLA